MITNMERKLGRIDVDNFSSTKFEMWKPKMEDLLNNQDLWDVIDENKKRQTYMTLSHSMTCKQKHKISLDYVWRTQFFMKKLSKKPSETYQEKSLLYKIFLRNKLYSL